MRFNFDFIGRRRQFYVLSAVILVVAIGGFFLRGLNLGIDFSGGIQMQVHFQKPVQLTTVDATLRKDGISNYFAVYLGSGKQNIQISMPAVSETLRATVDQSLTKDVGPYTITSFTKVTGSFSSQVVRGGVIAVLLASLGIILYMMIRFDLRFAISGIFAVFWDAFVSLGLVALIHFTVNAPFVAGVLTIIGYSINDRIIIFDRVRENLKKRGKESLAEIVNLSLNQTLGRS
ncbi:MAG: protein translocase subunit SecF, partial [Sulfobacillus sp.]